MLASPVSPSVSLGTRSSSSSSHTEGNTHSYASPRHPAYLPSGTTSNPQNNQALSPSHSISSKSSAATNTSNYSKYTTLSQIGRVNDVLVEKVLLHQPIPREQENEKGTALKRLIAFLDGDGEETRPASIAQEQQIQASPHEQDDRLNKQYVQYARPHQARETQVSRPKGHADRFGTENT